MEPPEAPQDAVPEQDEVIAPFEVGELVQEGEAPLLGPPFFRQE